MHDNNSPDYLFIRLSFYSRAATPDSWAAIMIRSRYRALEAGVNNNSNGNKSLYTCKANTPVT